MASGFTHCYPYLLSSIKFQDTLSCLLITSLWLTLLSTTFPVVILGDFNIFICPFQAWACNFLDSSNSTILSSDLFSCTCKEGESMGFDQKVSRLLNPALLWTISWCFQSVSIYGGINSNVSAFSNGYSSKENCASHFCYFWRSSYPEEKYHWRKINSSFHKCQNKMPLKTSMKG